MAIVHINSSTDTIGSQLNKINDTSDQIPVSGSYNSGTGIITLTKFGGGTFTITGITAGSGSSGGVFGHGTGINSIMPTGFTASQVSGLNSSLLGGSGAMDIDGVASGIVSGAANEVHGPTSIIGAGQFNVINSGGNYSGILAGFNNDIGTGVYGGAILGGVNNNINAGSVNSSILGGSGNTIDTNIQNASILAGKGLTNSLSEVAMTSGLAIPSGTSQGRLFIQQGTNCIVGVDTLGAGGTKVVSTTKASAASIVLLTPQSSLSGSLYISSISNGTSFTVASTNSADTCSFGWFIIHNFVS